MAEAKTRTKRSSTLSKIGKIFGVHEPGSVATANNKNANNNSISAPVSPNIPDSETMGNNNKNFPSSSLSSRLNSINGSRSSLVDTSNTTNSSSKPNSQSNTANPNHLVKALNNLKVEEKLRNPSSSSSASSLTKRIPSFTNIATKIEEEETDQDQEFSAITSTVSNPSTIQNSTVMAHKVRNNRSKSISSKPRPSKSHGFASNVNTNNNNNTKKYASEPSISTKDAVKRDNAPIKDKYGGRLKILENGTHVHILKNTKRQEKLTTMIKNFLGAKKLRDESVSAVSNILPNIIPTNDNSNHNNNSNNAPPTLVSNLMSKIKQNENGKIEVLLENKNNLSTNLSIQQRALNFEGFIDSRSFAEKYGTCQEVIGKGTFGIVKISHKKINDDHENLYAVKEFRRRNHELEKDYSQRLAREFCISSSLKNIHIIQTLDLLQDAKGDYCEVMEFCTGGDLYTLIVTAGKLEYIEADCFFKQLVRGVTYMHTMGVAHRDIKPENILLTADGNLKITDFGTSECFSFAWDSTIHLFQGIIGSAPYIAPELYNSNKKYDLRPPDIWACGVVYMAMRTGRQLWCSANSQEDEFYQEYLKGRKDENGYYPIEQLKRARCRNVIYSILDPIPTRRITAKQILNSEWGREIKCCEAGECGTKTDNIYPK